MGSDHRRLYYQLDVPVGFGPEPAGPGAGQKHCWHQYLTGHWFIAFLPLGILLILAMPLLAYWFYPPEVKVNNEVPLWAARELEKLGKLSRNEILLLVFVCFALMMWIFAADWIEPALAALLVIVLMLWTGVLSGAISPTTKRHGTPLSGSPPWWHWPTASPPPALSPGWVKRAAR